MQDCNRTTQFMCINGASGSLATIFDGNSTPRVVQLDEFGKDAIYFGRDPKNDIVLNSHLVSAEHGRFVRKGDEWVMEDKQAYRGNESPFGSSSENVPN